MRALTANLQLSYSNPKNILHPQPHQPLLRVGVVHFLKPPYPSNEVH